MPIRKNKKRFDPRYFMNEKLEEPLKESNQKGLTIDHSVAKDEYHRRQAEKKDEERRKESERNYGNIEGNVDKHTTVNHSVNHSLEEDLSHLADPEVWKALGEGGAKMLSIWVPLILSGGLATVLGDAIKYLKDGSTEEESIKQAMEDANKRSE